MQNWRINLIFIFLSALGAAIIGQLFYLQVINHKLYMAQALGQQTALGEMQGERGEVFLKNNGKSLAVNDDKYLLSAVPKDIVDKQETASTIAEIVGMKTSQVFSLIDNDSSYTTIKNKLSDEEVAAIKKIKIKGINLERSAGRYYPQKNLASQIIGFVGGDGLGQYGIEGYYENLVKGKKSYETILDGGSLNGPDLYLTIDYSIQYKAESLLKKAKENFDIDSGQIIVMRPDTGEIVAMADYPGFDPNNYSKEKDLDIFQNGAVQKLFECGSVLKPITMAAALNEKTLAPDTTYVDEGFVKIGNNTIYNFDKTKKYGVQTMTNVLENSLNTGAVFAEKTLDAKTYLQYLENFGLFERTGVDLQGEVYSNNDNLKKGREVNLATASFGQGIVMTPIQLLRAFSAIANNGKMVRPYVVEKIINDQEETTVTEPKIVREVISKETADTLTNMLISAVKNGFANKAGVNGYYVAGKTGTAQVANEDRPGYDLQKSVHSFIGFAPALKPQFIALVKLDNPKTGSSGVTAAPIFSELAQYTLNYWQVPPDYDYEENK